MAEDLRGFVTRAGDEWWWTDLPDGTTRTLCADELESWLVKGDVPAAVHALGYSWVAEVVDSRLVVRGVEPPVALSAADVRSLESGPLEMPTIVQSGALPSVVARGRHPLWDRDASARLLENGWTVLRLLDDEGVDRLRSAYGELHGWSGSGFEPDPGNPDGEYRAKVFRAVTEVVGSRLREVLEDFGVFMAGFYSKWPDTPEIDLHWDWSCVDESNGHRAYLMWVALQDTDQNNGQMWVLPGSHRIDLRPRGSHLAIPLSDEFARSEAAARALLRPVPLRAGEALLFDMGVVHISSPNLSPDPRLACVIGLRPTEVPLVYYRRLVDDVVVRYNVDESWYASMVPSELMDVPPDFPPHAAFTIPATASVSVAVGAFLGVEECAPGVAEVLALARPGGERRGVSRWVAMARARRST